MALYRNCFSHETSWLSVFTHMILMSILGIWLLTEVFEGVYHVEHQGLAQVLFQNVWFYVGALLIVILSCFLAMYISKQTCKQNYLALLAKAVEFSGEAIAIVDAQGLIQYVNPAFVSLTGYAAHEAIGQSALDLLSSPTQSEKQVEEALDKLQCGESWQGKLVNKKKDGHFYPVNTSISPIRNSKGVVTHYVVLQNDETLSQKLHEKEIQEAKMKSLATAVGGIAHEFNNILTGIMGNAFLIKLKEHDQDLKDKLETIEGLGDRAAVMVQQMLVYVGHELQDHRHVCIHLNQLVQASVAVFNKENGMHCQFQGCKDNVMIKGDVTALSDAVMQILSNAKDAVAQVASPKVIVHVEIMRADVAVQYQSHATETYACVRLMNNGPKIPPEIKDVIFEPFFSTKEVGEGTGLGLSTVYGTVKEHNGFVTLDDSTDKGCTFLLCLPVYEEADASRFMGESI
jgi:PAS domain S-box-containing protein